MSDIDAVLRRAGFLRDVEAAYDEWLAAMEHNERASLKACDWCNNTGAQLIEAHSGDLVCKSCFDRDQALDNA